MIRVLLVIIVGLTGSGCATRGALDIPCPRFVEMVEELPRGGIEADIQADAEPGQRLHAASASSHVSPLQAAAQQAVARQTLTRGSTSAPSDILLLSGGGQWGAFGAGFLHQLHADGSEHLPRPALITGVSTGGLQTLYLALAEDDQRYAKLLAQYQPEDEQEIVDRNPMWMTPIRGSVAGLSPLRRRIERALCTDGDPARGCPMIDALARRTATSPTALIGFVEASSGRFLYVDVRQLAALAADGRVESRREAQQCLTGAALASAAMPVFFQQVRVNGTTYYDGGVRQSVFEAAIGREMQLAATSRVRNLLQQRRSQLPLAEHDKVLSAPSVLGMLEEATPRLFVIRNGPTVLERDKEPNQSAGPLTNALRAEAIIVNELEVGSIAELRLTRPTGEFRVVTADGFKCEKRPAAAMFSPSFMQCLARFGAARAGRQSPWLPIRPITGAEAQAEQLIEEERRR